MSSFSRLYEHYDMYHNAIILSDKVKFLYLNAKSYSLGELIFQLSYHVVSALGHAKEDVQSQRLSSRDLISLCQTRRFGEREAF